MARVNGVDVYSNVVTQTCNTGTNQAPVVAFTGTKQVEPNSTLGKAIRYLLNHWKKLTLFLRVAGAPLDNNICEQALKRKNALLYQTMHGAAVGDLYTCT